MTMQRMILVSDCLIERLTTIVRVFGVTGPERDSSQLLKRSAFFILLILILHLRLLIVAWYNVQSTQNIRHYYSVYIVYILYREQI